MSAVRRALLLAISSAAVFGCAPPPTQIIVHVDAEDELRSRTDQLRIRIWGRSDDESRFDDEAYQFETAPTNPGDIPWPWMVDLRPRASDPTRVWRIEAAAYDGAAPDPEAVDISPNLLAVSRTSASYAEGRIQHVYLLLYDACIDGEPCLDPNSTCAASGRCERIRDPNFFNPDAGLPDGGGMDAGPEDAGRPDAGQECSPMAEICNDRDEDCDGRVDETFDLTTDVNRCGGCNTICAAANSSAVCDGAACVYMCDPGYRNCDDDPGCERPIDASDCTRCDAACPGSTPICNAGTCVSSCDAPTELCGTTCVDTDVRVDHCGGCGVVCPDAPPHTVRTCMGGMCQYACEDDWDDCNRDLATPETSDGCEVDLTLVESCGACSNRCETIVECSFPVCSDGRCLAQPANSGDCMVGTCSGTCSAGSCNASCPPDAGPPDAGPPDAGPPDAGPPDAGPCAGCPADKCCAGLECCTGLNICSLIEGRCVPPPPDAGGPIDAGSLPEAGVFDDGGFMSLDASAGF